MQQFLLSLLESCYSFSGLGCKIFKDSIGNLFLYSFRLLFKSLVELVGLSAPHELRIFPEVHPFYDVAVLFLKVSCQ